MTIMRTILYYPAKEKPKKYFQIQQLVNLFPDPQPTEIENNEFIIAHDNSQLQNNVYLTLKAQDSAEFREVKQAGLDNQKQYNVYTETKDVGQKRLNGRWVCTRKIDNNITQLKARYVIKGFQEKSSIQPDSPTGSKKCLRIILAIVSSTQWLLNSIDINSAFLQGKPISRDIFIVLPPEAHPTKSWKLQNCVYGLNDAVRKWYFAAYEELEKLGCHRSSIDYSVFFWYHDHHL